MTYTREQTVEELKNFIATTQSSFSFMQMHYYTFFADHQYKGRHDETSTGIECIDRAAAFGKSFFMDDYALFYLIQQAELVAEIKEMTDSRIIDLIVE